jgi:hypothetical protein
MYEIYGKPLQSRRHIAGRIYSRLSESGEFQFFRFTRGLDQANYDQLFSERTGKNEE